MYNSTTLLDYRKGEIDVRYPKTISDGGMNMVIRMSFQETIMDILPSLVGIIDSLIRRDMINKNDFKEC